MSAELQQNVPLTAEQRARLKALMLGSGGGSKQPAIPAREDSKAPAPLSPAQRRLWILSSLDPKNTAYNLASLFRVSGKLDEDALGMAVAAMEQRHEMLRTVFGENKAGEPQQQVRSHTGRILYKHDLRGSLDGDSNDHEALIRQTVWEEANVNFDLRNGPLWRVSLIRVADDNALLLINVHHIAFDGWSLGVFVRELFGYYGEAKQTGGINVTPLPVQYADYSIWNTRRIEEGIDAVQKKFWREYLNGIPTLLDLPRDRARPEQSSGEGSIRQLIMTHEKFRRLCELGRREGATPFNVFMTLFTLLLYRYTGQTDIVLGTPVSGREVEESHSLIGVLANTLPIRTRLKPDSTFREILREVRAAALDAFANSDLSFDAIVEAVRPERVAGANPVFQVMFAYQNKVDPVEVDGLHVIYEIFDPGTSKFDLSLDIFEGPEGPTCIFEYDTDLFDHARMKRMVGHFDNMADAVLASPDTPISHLEYLRKDERAVLLANAGANQELPYKGTFIDVFNAQVEVHTNEIALVDGDRELSYAQLDRRSTIIAHALRDKGLSCGGVVGLCMHRSAALMETILGVLKADAAFVALDPGHPPERLRYLATDAGAHFVITGKELAESLPAFPIPLLHHDELVADTSSGDRPLPESESQPQDTAYLIYTSGTTGEPKGARISHRNWLNALHGWVTVYELGGKVGSHLQMANFPFDVFCGDFIRAFGSGGKLVICPQVTLGDAPALFALMRQHRIACAEFVPAVFRQLAAYLHESGEKLDFVRVLIVASDSWYKKEYREYRTLIGAQTRLINSYGMAEATIDSTWFEDSYPAEDDASGNQTVPIGRPFPNVEVYLLDDNRQTVPVGIPGEICIGGEGVSDGYLNRPELTRLKFIPHPLRPGEQIYRSGDIGCLRPDGQLELLGRVDHQVKLRGQRIEPVEIETALLRHAAIRECLVLLHSDGPDVPQLVAYVVMADKTESPDVAALREHLQQWIPPHMIPSVMIALPKFPLSANGKIDRRALPKPEKREGTGGKAFIAPRTLIEELVSDTWSRALARQRIGVHDNFFELGGHSLIALQIVARLRTTCGVDLPVQSIFKCPTIAKLAGKIAELQGQGEHHEVAVNAITAVMPDPANRYEPFPLTPVQEAYWLGRSDIFEFGNISAHSYDEFETGVIDTARFERAWNKVVRRHDMLRAVVKPDGTQQVMPETPHYKVAVVDLRDADADGVQAGLIGIRNEMSHQILDVQRWPAFDIRLSLLPGGKTRAHFSTDAIMFDVWSFLLVLDDLVNFYLNENVEPEPLAFSFRDYVLAEKARQENPRYQRALAYWRARVPELPPAPELPLAKTPSQVRSPRFTRLHATLEVEHWERLKQRAAGAGLTPTGVLLAAYAEILAAHSHSPQFSLNLTFLSRQPVHPQVHEVVGEFTSLSLLSIDNAAGASFVERARMIQADLWQDLEHHDIGGVQVLREIARATGDSTAARMPVVFTSALVLPMPEQKSDFPVTPAHRDGITQTSQVWLDCGVWEEQGMLLCNWDVVREMYSPGFIETMFDCFQQFIRRLADDETLWRDNALALSVVPSEQQPLPIVPQYDDAVTAEQTLVSLFLNRVETDADAVAVRSGNRTLTYRQLAEHAFRLSRRLRAQDAEPGSLVAVVMHKGWEQAVATLGVMASGAAYLPIDPDLPESRIRYLLDHGRVRHIVIQPWLCEQFQHFENVDVHVIDDDSDEPCADGPDVETLPAADDLAYVIFTSGSTGTPKGVMIDHRGAVNTIADINKRFDVNAADSVLAVSALNFDLSVYDLFGMFAAGGCVVFPDYERRLDPAHWFALIDRHAITLWNTVPALSGLLTDYAQGRKGQLPSLRHMMMSGDWIPLHLPERIRDIAPQASLISLGGATEASIWSILYSIGDIDPEWQSIPYGRAMKNQGIHILNHRLEPCPTWVTGDIYIGGIGLALGYWRDKAKTDAAFIVHPRTGARLYRTGDLGRWRPDGNVEFLGRIDHQVKVQGHRIELGEIEVTLLQHPAVKEAVISVIGEKHGPKRLIGYVVPKTQIPPEADELQAFLQKTLPDYMVPQAWVVLEQLPLSANGKVDRKALPHPDIGIDRNDRNYVAPRSELERRLADIWRELLQAERIGIHDNFFHIGGDSMLAVKMMMRLRADLTLEVNLAQIFSAPTIARLAPLVESGQA